VRAHFASAGLAEQRTPEYLEIVDDFPRGMSGFAISSCERDFDSIPGFRRPMITSYHRASWTPK
jgi:hypothetical protein